MLVGGQQGVGGWSVGCWWVVSRVLVGGQQGVGGCQ